MQAEAYKRGLKAAKGIDVDICLFIQQSTKNPKIIDVFEVSEDAFFPAAMEFDYLIGEIKKRYDDFMDGNKNAFAHSLDDKPKMLTTNKYYSDFWKEYYSYAEEAKELGRTPNMEEFLPIWLYETRN